VRIIDLDEEKRLLDRRIRRFVLFFLLDLVAIVAIILLWS